MLDASAAAPLKIQTARYMFQELQVQIIRHMCSRSRNPSWPAQAVAGGFWQCPRLESKMGWNQRGMQ